MRKKQLVNRRNAPASGNDKPDAGAFLFGYLQKPFCSSPSFCSPFQGRQPRLHLAGALLAFGNLSHEGGGVDALTPVIIRHSGLDGLFRQDGAVYLHRRQPVQGFHNGFVGELQRVFHALSLDEFRSHAAGGNCRAAAEGHKGDVLDDAVFHLDVHAHDVSALGVSHFPHAVCILHFTHVAGVGKMVHNLFTVCHTENPVLSLHVVGDPAVHDGVPKRGHGPQALDDGGQRFDNIIHVLHGAVISKGEAQGAVGHLVGQADGQQHMAGVQGTAGAGGAGGGANALHVQHQQQGFPLHALETETHVSRKAVFQVTVEAAAVDLQNFMDQLVPHGSEPCNALVHRGAGPLHGHRQAHDFRHVFRTGAAAPLLCAAVHKILNGDAGTEVQCPHALWRVDLVSAEGEHVDILFLHVDVHVADGLHRIGVEQHAVLFADGADFRDGLDGADFVVGVHDGDQGGLIRNGGFQLIRMDDPVFVHVQIGDFKPFLFQRLAGVQHCVVLKGRGDDVVFPFFPLRPGRTLDGPVVAFAAAAGKIDFVGVGAQTARRSGAGLFQGGLCIPPQGIEARGVAVNFFIEGEHGLEHFR